MNRARRSKIRKVEKLLHQLQEHAADIREAIAALAEEERKARDNLMASVLNTYQGDHMMNAYCELVEAGDAVDDIDTHVEWLLGSLGRAAEKRDRNL